MFMSACVYAGLAVRGQPSLMWLMTYNPVPSGFLSCVGWFSSAFQSLSDILSSGFSFCELAQVFPVCP